MTELLPIVAWLRAERIRQGRSQEEVAGRAGYTRAALANYEAGRADPSSYCLGRLMHALGYELGAMPVAVPGTHQAPPATPLDPAETEALFQQVIGLIVEACGYNPATVKAQAQAAVAAEANAGHNLKAA